MLSDKQLQARRTLLCDCADKARFTWLQVAFVGNEVRKLVCKSNFELARIEKRKLESRLEERGSNWNCQVKHCLRVKCVNFGIENSARDKLFALRRSRKCQVKLDSKTGAEQKLQAETRAKFQAARMEARKVAREFEFAHFRVTFSIIVGAKVACISQIK